MMSYRIFLAGASGAIGKRLTPLLHSAGHYVCGSTRSKAKADALRSQTRPAILVELREIRSLEQYTARRGQIEPRQQRKQSRFTRTGSADHRDRFPGRDV